MRFLADQRFLAIYSGILTVVFAVTALCGFAALRSQSFDQITVHRIHVIEPDGTLRLILSDRAAIPGAFVRGKEYPRPDRRDAAGLLFMNDEGSEMGGLIWSGLKDKDGKIQNHAHLSFDQYEQDQILQLIPAARTKISFPRSRSANVEITRFNRHWMPACRSTNCPRISRLRNGRNSSRLIPVTRTGSIWAGRPTNPRLCGLKTNRVPIASLSASMLEGIR
jgi:hypothetical protein